MTANGADSSNKQARIASIVIIVTFPTWMLLSWLGGRLGWETRFVFLFDMMAIAAFIWSLFVLFQVWRRRQEKR